MRRRVIPQRKSEFSLETHKANEEFWVLKYSSFKMCHCLFLEISCLLKNQNHVSNTSQSLFLSHVCPCFEFQPFKLSKFDIFKPSGSLSLLSLSPSVCFRPTWRWIRVSRSCRTPAQLALGRMLVSNGWMGANVFSCSRLTWVIVFARHFYEIKSCKRVHQQSLNYQRRELPD